MRTALLLPALAALASAQFTLVVDPGDVPRPPVCPVVVTLDLDALGELPANEGDLWSARVKSPGHDNLATGRTVRDADGRAVGVELAWFEHRLAAGTSVEREVTLSPSEGPGPGSLHLVEEDGSSVLKHQGDTLWRHMTAWDPERHDDTFRPYTHLYGSGDLCLTKGPGGLYPHHRGVFCGWTRTRVGGKAYNFWSIPRSDRPHQEHVEWVAERSWSTPILARNCSRIEWQAPDGKVIVEELREWDTWRYDGAPGSKHVLLDYRVTLIPRVDEPIHLDGDPAHAGFQVRMAQSVADAKACTYTFPEGVTGGGGDNWQNAAWVAAGFPIGERRFELLYHDHPDNPDPIWNTRNYGRFGAFFKHTLEPGRPLELRYALRLREVLPDQEELDAAGEHASWTTPVVVTVK